MRGPSETPPVAIPASAVAQPTSAQAALLDAAMRAASSLESPAHRRVRTRLQRDTAVAALELGMADRAVQYAQRIDDWRRGEVLAIAAQALAREGRSEAAQERLATAIGVVPSTEGWMRERLVTEIGVAYAVLGQIDDARRQGAMVPAELTGRVEAELVQRVPDTQLDGQCDAFDQAIASGSLDIVRSGVDGYLQVIRHVRADAARAARAEAAIRGAIPGLPPELQVETAVRLAVAIDSPQRREDARRDLETAERQLAAMNLAPDTAGPLTRDLANGFTQIGDPAHARDRLHDLLTNYERNAASFVDVERADYLRPIAEALRQAGDRDGATRTWMLALDAGATNPNGRPRAEDLCLTCLSLARAGERPSTEMQRRIDSIQAGLKAPW